MNKADSGTGMPLWEYVLYVLVTVPLLLIGVVLWLVSVCVRSVRLIWNRNSRD